MALHSPIKHLKEYIDETLPGEVHKIRIIASLAGDRNYELELIPEAELQEMRNSFLWQDYYYLLGGYQSARILSTALWNSNKVVDLKLTSRAVTKLQKTIKQENIAYQSPNQSTLDYIKLKIESANHSLLAYLSASLACFGNFYGYKTYLNENEKTQPQNEIIQDWINVICDYDYEEILMETYFAILECSDYSSNSRLAESTINYFFYRALDHEFAFFQNLSFRT